MDREGMLKWPLILGGSVGLATGIPLIGILNACTCCSMVALAGFAASWLSSRDAAAGNVLFDVGRGAIVGVLTGLCYGVVNGVTESILALAAPGMAVSLLESFREFAESAEGVPPATLDQLDDLIAQAQNPTFSLFAVLFSMFKGVIVGAIFCTVGGLIGGAVFKVDPKVEPPQPPAGPTPPAPPVVPPAAE